MKIHQRRAAASIQQKDLRQSITAPADPWLDGQVTNTSSGEDIWSIIAEEACRSSKTVMIEKVTPRARKPKRPRQLRILKSAETMFCYRLLVYGLLLVIPTCLAWNMGVRFGHDAPGTTPPGERRQAFKRIAASSLAIIMPFAHMSPSSARNLPESVSVDPSKVGTQETLQPILDLKHSLETLRSTLQLQDDVSAGSVDAIVKAIPRTEKSFKAIFDAYSEPVSYKQKFVDQNAFLVYYTKGFDGPGRPSIESDLPVKQTLQYGFRNDAWVAWEDFVLEFEYQRKNHVRDQQEDLVEPLINAISAIDGYLAASSDVR